MTGLIKADLKKLFRTKSLYVCMFIAAALGVCMSLLYNYFWQERGQNIALWYALMDRYGMSTELIDEAFRQIPSQNLMSYINIFLSDGAIWLMGAPCICAFCSAEYNNGTYKNTISRGVSRTKLFISKALASLLELFIISLVYIAAGSIAALPHVELTSPYEAGQIAFMLIIYFVLIAASAAVFKLLTEIFIRSGFAVAAAIAAPMLIASVIQIIALARPDMSDLSRYILMNTFVTVQQSVKDGSGWTELITGAGYAVISLVAGWLIFSKRELK